jgi:hypothetical protein
MVYESFNSINFVSGNKKSQDENFDEASDVHCEVEYETPLVEYKVYSFIGSPFEDSQIKK